MPYNGGTITPSTHPYPCPIIGAKENLEANARVADCIGDPEHLKIDDPQLEGTRS